MDISNNVIFTILSGLMVPLLLVWAQLWTTMAKSYNQQSVDKKPADAQSNDKQPLKEMPQNEQPDITAGYGLSYCYYAILASFLAFLITIITRDINLFSLSLFIFSIIITLSLIIITTFAVVIKTWQGKSLFTPLNYGWLKKTEIKIIILFAIPLVLLVAIYSFWILIYINSCFKCVFGFLG